MFAIDGGKWNAWCGRLRRQARRSEGQTDQLGDRRGADLRGRPLTQPETPAKYTHSLGKQTAEQRLLEK